MIGKVINERYTITDKLGGGGMSIVYLAVDSILNRKVAIKAISIPPSEKEEHLNVLKEKYIILLNFLTRI